MMTMEMLPYVGFLGGFGVSALVWAVVSFITNTRRWHEKYHRDGLRIMCDRCMRIAR